ncbi:hypothetical protein LCGC14_0885210 [marine sediment metagenome]|uniref:Zinc ABC transporter substrate-binding protein n=1 Tax=marine sediment metagenome TaxID=412755 RepID=A0A0F9P5Q5_9ZZZZ
MNREEFMEKAAQYIIDADEEGVVELAKKYRIKVIFFEIRVRDELAKVLAEEIGARTLVLNPGANLTKEQLKSGKTFFDIMEANLENLKDGLDCK